MSLEKVSFLKFDQEFLALSWDWLNDPEIKKLTSTPDITREGQLKWFESLDSRNDYKVWGVACGTEKIGVVGLKKITPDDAEYFGYIGVKSYWGKGISKDIFAFILQYLENRGLNRLWLTVAKENQRAVKAYEKSGFKIFSTDEGNNYMELNALCRS